MPQSPSSGNMRRSSGSRMSSSAFDRCAYQDSTSHRSPVENRSSPGVTVRFEIVPISSAQEEDRTGSNFATGCPCRVMRSPSLGKLSIRARHCWRNSLTEISCIAKLYNDCTNVRCHVKVRRCCCTPLRALSGNPSNGPAYHAFQFLARSTVTRVLRGTSTLSV
jgi:hypothetical protein